MRIRNRAAALAAAMVFSTGCATVNQGPNPVREDAGELMRQMQLHQNDPYWPYMLGRTAAEKDSLRIAENWFKQALDRDSLYVPALSHLTQVQYQAGRHQDAVDLLEAAKGSWSGVFPPALEAGLALHLAALGLQEMAQATAEASRNQSVVAYVYLRGDQYQLAQVPAFHAHENNPEDPVALNNLGITLLQQGDPLQAREIFVKAAELDASLPGPLYNLAALECFYTRDLRQAKIWFDRYLVLDTADPDGIGQTLAQHGVGE